MVPMATATPSLQRLLALDKDFGDLQEQLDQAAQILGLPNDWKDFRAYDCQKVVQRQSHGRAEWVLRWLLGKLKSEEVAGENARSNARAWILLGKALCLVPDANSARLLNAYSFLSCVEKAMEENFDGAPERALDTTLQCLSRSSRSDRDVSECSATLEKVPRGSKKRKRPGSTDEDPTPKKRAALSEKEINSLFHAIDSVLSVIIFKSETSNGTDSRIITDQMHSVLRCDSAMAAHLLKWWLTAISGVLTRGTIHDDTPNPFSTLKTILHIWDLRSMGVANHTDASAVLFSKECLLIASRLLVDLSLSHMIEPRNNIRTDALAANQTLERLLARHVFVPARADFFSEEKAGLKSWRKGNNSKLYEYLKPIHNAIQTGNPQGLSPRNKLVRAAEKFLQIAIRCSSRSTPKRRTIEVAWIQTVFVVLADCVGCPVDGSAQSQPGEVSLDALGSLMNTMKIEKCPLEADVLEAVVKTYSRLVPVTGINSPRWPLIANVIALDADVFLPKPGQGNKPGTGFTNEDLSGLIFERISAIAHERSLKQTSAAKDDDSDDGDDMPDDELEKSVIVPIFKAYCRARDLNGFISRFNTQLCQPASEPKSTTLAPSIWEGRKLRSAFQSLLESSLTPAQIAGLLEQQGQKISDLLTALATSANDAMVVEPSKEVWSSAKASIILLDILLEAIRRDETLESLVNNIHSLQTDLTALVELEAYQSNMDMAKTWRCLSALFSMQWSTVGPGIHESEDYLSSSLVRHAQNSIAIAGDNISDAANHVAFEALVFLLKVCDHFRTIPASHMAIRRELKGAISAPATLIGPNGLEKLSPKATIEIVVLLRFPALLQFIDSNTRRSLFMNLCLKAMTDKYRNGFYLRYVFGLRSDLVLNAYFEYIFDGAPSDVKDDLLHALFIGLDPDKFKVVQNIGNCDSIAFSERQYLQLPLISLPRKHREAVLDEVTALIRNSTAMDDVQMSRHLSLMVKVMEVPNATATISTDPNALWEIASPIHSADCITNDTILELLQELVRLVLRHIIAIRDQKRGQKYLQEMQSQLEKYILNTSSFMSSPGTLRLIKTMMTIFEGINYIPDQGRKESLRKKYSEVLMADFKDVTDATDAGDKLSRELKAGQSAVIDALAEFPSQALTKQIWFHGMESYLHDAAEKWCIKILGGRRRGETLTDAIWPIHKFVARYYSHSNIRQFLRFSKELMCYTISAHHVHTILETARAAVAPLDMQKRVSAALNLLPKTSKKTPHEEELQLINVILSTLENTKSIREEANEDDDDDEVATFFERFCTYLQDAKDIQTFQTLLDCIGTVLKDKPWLLSQWDIDNVAASFEIVASPKGPSLALKNAGSIYSRICDMVHTLILLHRTKLGGRFHLVMSLLQSLLIGLFTPNSRHSTSFIASLPPWLASGRARLTPAHATSYARVLSTLCSPTVSSVTSRKRHGSTAELTDATKKAKAYAGQHVQTIVSQYCSCMLQGRLTPEMRSALIPGLFACLDVMDMEAMRAMNAAMDASSRAIWRSLYGEWNKFGKWKER